MLKEFGGELSVAPTLDPSPGTNRRKLSYESLGYLYMQSKGYATIESWLKKTSISYPDYYNDLKPLKVQYFIFSWIGCFYTGHALDTPRKNYHT